MIVQDRGVVYADAVIGPKRKRTPEGFLLCEDVPIARTGVQDYLNGELEGVEPGSDGVIKVERRPEDVFRDETVRSFEGKDVTDDHPEELVVPGTYKEHTVGVVLNPRRGDGALSDCLLADLLIKDADAIEAIEQDQKRQVSCGYDADYESLGPGRARQHNIVGNHVALVDRGRCGHRCSIGDSSMAKTWKDKLLGILAHTTAKDAAGFMKEVQTHGVVDADMSEQAGPKSGTDPNGSDPDGPGVHVHVHGIAGATTVAPTDDDAEDDPNEKRFKGIEDRMDSFEGGLTGIKDSLEKLASRSGGDDPENDPLNDDEEPIELQAGEDNPVAKDRRTARDADPLRGEHRIVAAGCEVLVPGFKAPTFDASADAKTTRDSLCLARRRALTTFARTKDGGPAVSAITGSSTFNPKMPCAQLATVFNAAVALTKDRRSHTVDLQRGEQPGAGKLKGVPKSIDDFNTMSQEFWNKQSGKKS